MIGPAKDSLLRRTLIGPSLAAYLRTYSSLPVLFAPSMEVHCPAGKQPSPTFKAMKAQRLLAKPARFHRASAPAA